MPYPNGLGEERKYRRQVPGHSVSLWCSSEDFLQFGAKNSAEPIPSLKQPYADAVFCQPSHALAGTLAGVSALAGTSAQTR